MECDFCGDRFEVVEPPGTRDTWSPAEGLAPLIEQTAPELAGSPAPRYRAEALVLGALRANALWPLLSHRLWPAAVLAIFASRLGGTSQGERVLLGALAFVVGGAAAVVLSLRTLKQHRMRWVLEKVTRYQVPRADLVAAREALRSTSPAAVELLDRVLSLEERPAP